MSRSLSCDSHSKGSISFPRGSTVCRKTPLFSPILFCIAGEQFFTFLLLLPMVSLPWPGSIAHTGLLLCRRLTLANWRQLLCGDIYDILIWLVLFFFFYFYFFMWQKAFDCMWVSLSHLYSSHLISSLSFLQVDAIPNPSKEQLINVVQRHFMSQVLA